jgi:hypothetical protein
VVALPPVRNTIGKAREFESVLIPASTGRVENPRFLATAPKIGSILIIENMIIMVIIFIYLKFWYLLLLSFHAFAPFYSLLPPQS